MKKIALFLLVVLSTALFPGSVRTKDTDAPMNVRMGVAQYNYEYLVKTAPQMPSFKSGEEAKIFVSLSRCNDLVLIESGVLTVVADGFEITNAHGESAKNELSHTYNYSSETEKVVPDITTVTLKYTGDESACGMIEFKLTPSRGPGAASEKWDDRSTIYYAVNSDKIFFFNTEEEAQRKYNSLFFK